MNNPQPKGPQEIISSCQNDWQNPCATYAAGDDIDSSENALLVNLYGALITAAETTGLDADQAVIDVETLEILQHMQNMTDMPFDASEITAKLNGFIRSEVHYIWQEIPTFDEFEKNELALEFIDKVANLFIPQNDIAASIIMFYLFPMLPILEYQPNVPFADGVKIDKYEDFHRLALKNYRHIKPALSKIATKPAAHYGSAEQQNQIKQLLEQTDWWQRRIFNQTLRDSA